LGVQKPTTLLQNKKRKFVTRKLYSKKIENMQFSIELFDTICDIENKWLITIMALPFK
jgi:hypothetical protein